MSIQIEDNKKPVNTKQFLSSSSSKAHVFRDHFIFNLKIFFGSLDFHELWNSLMRICLITDVKWQWVMLVLGWVTVSVHYSCV